jgi:hypothetical protein
MLLISIPIAASAATAFAFSSRVPGLPATVVQPGVPPGLGSERQQCVVSTLGSPAAQAAAGLGPDGMLDQPLANAARVGARFSIGAGQTAFDLGEPRALVEEGPPVVRGPTAPVSLRQGMVRLRTLSLTVESRGFPGSVSLVRLVRLT